MTLAAWVPTAEQDEVLSTDGNLLVVGPPGTGKTTTALAKAARRVERGLDESQRVLFLSFSNAAVQRVVSASRQLLSRAVRRCVQVTTFHGLCHRILSSHCRAAGIPSPFSVLLPQDVAILRSTLSRSEVKREILRLEVDEGRVCFDRFAPLAAKVLRDHAPLQHAYTGAYPLVIVDEYQDTDDDQEALVTLLSNQSDLVCLGDPEQRIYDFRPRVRADRLDRLTQRASFRRIDLDGPNLRSGDADLVGYARAVVEAGTLLQKAKTVVAWRFHKKAHFVEQLKKAVVAVEKAVRKAQGSAHYRVSLAVMGMTNPFVGQLSEILRTPSPGFQFPFDHQVLVSQDELDLSWRIIGSVLEHNEGDAVVTRVEKLLRLMAQVEQVKGGKGALRHAKQLLDWADAVETGNVTGRMRAIPQIARELDRLARSRCGDPVKDVVSARTALGGTTGKHFASALNVLELRPPVGPYEEATEELAIRFAADGRYTGAMTLFPEVLLRERLLEGTRRVGRRVLMTLHKCKGKQFDAVIIVDWHYPPNQLLRPGDDPAEPYSASRRLLRVAITRAKYGVVILTPAREPCVLLPSIST